MSYVPGAGEAQRGGAAIHRQLPPASRHLTASHPPVETRRDSDKNTGGHLAQAHGPAPRLRSWTESRAAGCHGWETAEGLPTQRCPRGSDPMLEDVGTDPESPRSPTQHTSTSMNLSGAIHALWPQPTSWVRRRDEGESRRGFHRARLLQKTVTGPANG